LFIFYPVIFTTYSSLLKYYGNTGTFGEREISSLLLMPIESVINQIVDLL